MSELHTAKSSTTHSRHNVTIKDASIRDGKRKESYKVKEQQTACITNRVLQYGHVKKSSDSRLTALWRFINFVLLLFYYNRSDRSHAVWITTTKYKWLNKRHIHWMKHDNE